MPPGPMGRSYFHQSNRADTRMRPADLMPPSIVHPSDQTQMSGAPERRIQYKNQPGTVSSNPKLGSAPVQHGMTEVGNPGRTMTKQMMRHSQETSEALLRSNKIAHGLMGVSRWG